jgi:CubicO group peptidase (beta-lactamase class C family)
MVSWFAVAATLASPPQAVIASELPKVAISQLLTLTSGTESPSLGHRVAEAEPTADARMRDWLAHLAVVRSQPPVRLAQPTMQMFLTLAPVGRAVGLRAIGSF